MSTVFLILEKLTHSNRFDCQLFLGVKIFGMLTSLKVDLFLYGACFIVNFLHMILSCPEVFLWHHVSLSTTLTLKVSNTYFSIVVS